MDNSRLTLAIINLAFCFCIFTVLVQPTNVQAQGCLGKPRMLEYGELVLHESKKYYTYKCDPGYSYRYLDTDLRRDRVSCKDGKWVHSGDCRPDVDESKMCPPVPDLNNGRTFIEGRNPGNRVQFICNTGYTLEGSNERICYDDFHWTGSDPECIGGERTVEGLAKSLKKNFIDPNAAATATGEEESTARLSPGKNGLELYFLVDRSSSISEMNLNKAKKLMVQIMKVFNISSEPDGGKGGTRAAVITYAETAAVLFDLDDPIIRSVEAFEQKLSEIQAEGGGTNLMIALSTVRSMAMKRKVRNETNKAIFVITDGKSTEGGDTLVVQAERVKNDRYEIFALGIGDNVNIEELSKIVSEKVQLHLFIINKFEDLAEIADIIAEKKDFRLCGEAGETEQIASVTEANEGAWPWLGWFSRISINSKPVTCGGALVCDTWFLTAARCLHDDDGNVTRPEDIDIYLGVHKLTNANQGNAIGTKPTVVFIHPKYNHSYYLMKSYSDDKIDYFNQFYSEYDVALLQLNNASNGGPPLSPSIRPICALRGEEHKGFLVKGRARLQAMLTEEVKQPYESRKNQPVFVAGWGFSPEGATRVIRIRDALHQSRSIVDYPDFCKRTNPNVDPDRFFCVRNKDYKQRFYCNSDVGGPYMADIDGKFAILGIALENADCSTRSNIYLNVLHDNITGWMQNTLGNCSDPNDWLDPNKPWNKGVPFVPGS